MKANQLDSGIIDIGIIDRRVISVYFLEFNGTVLVHLRLYSDEADHHDENESKVGIVHLWCIPPMPRAIEKGIRIDSIHSYPEPALVPLG